MDKETKDKIKESYEKNKKEIPEILIKLQKSRIFGGYYYD